jgi:hypothetical protein
VPKELAKDATSLGTVVVTMPAADGPQDACQGKSPKIIVNAS